MQRFRASEGAFQLSRAGTRAGFTAPPSREILRALTEMARQTTSRIVTGQFSTTWGDTHASVQARRQHRRSHLDARVRAARRTSRRRRASAHRRRAATRCASRHAAPWLSASRNICRKWRGRALRGTRVRLSSRAGGRDFSRSLCLRPTDLDSKQPVLALRVRRGDFTGAVARWRELVSTAHEQLRTSVRMVSAR